MFGIDWAPHLVTLMAICGIYTIAVVSPGPDVALTIRNSVLYSRRVGVAGALGTTTGILIHLAYTVYGIGYLVSEMPMVMNAIRLAGACYLFYLGYLCFKSDGTMKGVSAEGVESEDEAIVGRVLTPWQAYRIGVINNLLNPMVILLFISILSNYITSETPAVVQAVYGTVMVLISFSWFVFVALFFSLEKIRGYFLQLGRKLEQITGGVLIALGARVVYLVGSAF